MASIRTRHITVVPTVTAGVYTGADALGGLLTFADAVPTGNGQDGAILDSVSMIDMALQNDITDLFLFKASFTATADNAAFDPSDADFPNCIGTIPIVAANYVAAADKSVATIRNIGMILPSTTDGALYGQLVTRGTPTYAATTDIKITIGIRWQ